MKKLLIFCLLLCFLFALLPVGVYAHSGRTDAEGGHYDHQNGGYHYHHGYPEHYHTDGICPYDYDDQTDHNTNTNNSNSQNENSTSSLGDIILQIIITILESVCIFFVLGFLIMCILNRFQNISDKVYIIIVILIGVASIILALTTDFVF